MFFLLFPLTLNLSSLQEKAFYFASPSVLLFIPTFLAMPTFLNPKSHPRRKVGCIFDLHFPALFLCKHSNEISHKL
ncbi:MAG: hypothetical protein EBQ87_05995 [Planctomycetes bacterium]|nr:hypothetical protein [Planctomycetota bacterium]